MVPGIDPRIDIAFKKVFGSDAWTDLTASLINAVLETSSGQRVVEVELLNPYTEPLTIDDKLSILDIKARDERGRMYNMEMQMLATASLAPRLLYYWSKLYSQQLSQGDDYTGLRPAISICFVNGEMFPALPHYRSSFRLLDRATQICLTEDLAMHVIELPKFNKNLAELGSALDLWLYFLKNGAGLDADALPLSLDRSELRKAMQVLKMLSQNDVERDLYEDRLKAKRDMQTLETLKEQWKAQFEAAQREAEAAQREAEAAQRQTKAAQQQTEAAQRQAEAAQRQAEAAQRHAEAAQREAEAAQRQAEATQREAEAARQDAMRRLAERILLCQRLLKQPATEVDSLVERSEQELKDLALRLEGELIAKLGIYDAP